MDQRLKLITKNMSKLIFLVICFSLGNIYAATYAKTTLEKLVKTSTFVVEAVVVEQDSRWDDAHKIIHTFVKIKIDHVLKGENVPEYITLRQLGGRVDDEAMIIHGAPDFQDGQEALLFLVLHDGHYKIHSLGMGKFDKQLENGIVYSINTSIASELIQTSNVKSESINFTKFRNDVLKSEIQLYK